MVNSHKLKYTLKVGEKMNKLLVATLCSILLMTSILAEDEAKKESKTNSEDSKLKTVAKDFEVSGVVTLKIIRSNKAAGKMYVIQTSEKVMVGFNSKIGDKEIDIKQFENKQVVVKGQNIETKEFNFDNQTLSGKATKITYINQFSSIELKEETENSKKADEKKKNDNFGNQPAN